MALYNFEAKEDPQQKKQKKLRSVWNKQIASTVFRGVMTWRITTYIHFPLPWKVINESTFILREGTAALLQMLCYAWLRQSFQGILKNQIVFHLVRSCKFIHNFNHIKKKRTFKSCFCNQPAGLISFPSETSLGL